MPVLPFSISYNKGIRGRFNFPSRSAVKRQNEAPFPTDTATDVIDIHDKSVGDEEFVSKGSLDSTSTERRVYYEPLDVNISPEPLMSSFPPEFLKRKTTDGSAMGFYKGADRQAMQAQTRESIEDGFGGLGFDDDAEDVIAKLQGMDASSFVGFPSSSGASQSHMSPVVPSTVDLNHAAATGRRALPVPIQISTTNGAPSQRMHDDEPVQAEMSQSRISTPESSAVSGTTLARQLINNTFVLSIDTRDSRRYRSGTSTLTRSDSATLPAGDYPFFSPLNGDVPPVPPMPSDAELVILASKASTPHSLLYRRKTGEFKRRSSTGSLNLSPSSQSGPVAYSDIPVTAVIDTESVKKFRRISRISEATTTSLPGTPARATNDMESEAENKDDEAAIASSPDVLSRHENEQDVDSQEEQKKEQRAEPPPPLQGSIIQGSLKPLPQLPLSPTTTSENAEQTVSPREFDIDSYYSAFTPDSLPRGFRPAFSPITEVSEPTGSMSPTTVATLQRRYSQRSSVAGQFSPGLLSPDYLGNRGNGSFSSESRNHARLPIRERPMSQISPSYRRHQSNGSSSSTGSGSELISPSVGDGFRRKRSGSAPSPIVVFPDRELGKYRITISPLDQRDTPPSTSGIGHQTFPETPYSPQWSVPFAHGTSSMRGDVDANLPPFPQTPMSASAATFGFTGQGLAQTAQTSRVARLSRLGPTRSMGARPLPTKVKTTDSGGAPLVQSQEQNQVAVGEGTDSRPPVQGREHPGSVEQSQLSNRDDVTQSLPDRSGDAHHQQESSHTSITTTESTDRLTASSSSDYLEPSRINAVTHQLSSSSLNHPSSPTLQPPTPFICAGNMGDSPPAYDTVFGDRLASGSPPITPAFGLPSNFGRSPRNSIISLNQDSPVIASLRPRPRPRLPTGPRERRDTREGRDLRSVSGPMRDRNGSISSINSTLPSGVSSQPISIGVQSPRFQVQPPKFKGVTMEAAKWTFTTDELQAIASRAIREAAEGSSIRLLHLRTLDNDIPEDLRRLEAEGREIQFRYKACSRRRQKLLDNLSNSLSSPGNESPGASLRVIETLKEVTAQMDKLAEDLHSVDAQIARLNGLVLRHSGGALSMALRKLNKSWHEKVAELDDLKLKFRRVEAEREEAYRQADEACRQVDEVMQKVANQPSDAHRRMSVRRFKAGLHSAASRRSSFNSTGNRMSVASIPGSSARSPFAFEDIPPVPSIPRPGGRVREMYINIPPPQTPLHSNAGQTTGPTPDTPDPGTLLEQEALYGDIERRINTLRRSRSFGAMPLTADPRARMMMMGIPITRRNSTSSSSPLPLRPSSLPGDPGLSDAKRAMNADTDAMLVTLRLLSDTL